MKAAEGNTLTGHTFDFYRLGSYGDITAGTTGTDVKSLTVNKIDDASDKWIAAANVKAGITDLQGFDAAGDLAHATGDKNRQSPTDAKQTMLREAAKRLADTVAKSGVKAAKTVGGSGSTLTVAGLDNGLYLVVDSNGSPMIVGTPVQGTKTLNGITLGNLTIKSKTVSIDKKVARDRGHKSDFIDSKAGNTETSASWNVGDTVDFSYTFTMPNKQNTGEVQVVDVMDGLKLEGAPVFKVGQTAITPANVANAQDDRGFTATFGRAVIDANENKIVTVIYKATVTDAEYQSLLRSDATGTMGVLSVPAIGVELPIRHGTGPDVLDDGLGHVHGTSLPVGGRSTRTVISGHTNMEGRTLFTRLDELRKGQTFAIGVYGRVLHYRIVDIRVTSPSDTEALGIRPGRDLATLLTCTDTGNTRRLLVTGERYAPAAGEAAQTDMRAARDGALACGGAVALAGIAVARRDRERLCRHTSDAFRPGERRS